jgi:accessory colonization factor AcfC
MNDNKVIKVFSARACAAPLEKAAKIFEEKEGIKVEVSVCSRHCASPEAEEATGPGAHDFLDEIAEDGIYDLAISGAEYLLDDGEIRGIVQRGQRRVIARREAAILVPSGNPKNIKTLEDISQPGIKIGVSVIDCLKGLWEDIAARLNIIEKIQGNITFYANGCIAIVEAVAENKVDAAFGWTAFKHLEPERIEVVALSKDQSISRGTGIGLLESSKEPKAAKDFMSFLATPEAKVCYKEYGWV